MNLFRSEEHVKAWPPYNPISEEAIMPLADWATALSGPMCRERLTSDILSRRGNYLSELLSALEKLGRTGPFWTP
jgi:hypothetical protein